MKKLLSMFFALAMTVSLGTTAFATTPNTTLKEKKSQDIDVQAKYIDNSSITTTYSVDITWGDMQFTYSKSGTKTWQPSDHTYDGGYSHGWTASGNTIEVVNHSNAKVSASFAFAALAAYNSVNGTFDIASKELSAGAEGKPAEADSVTSTLTLGGTLDSAVTAFTKVGTITVTIA